MIYSFDVIHTLGIYSWGVKIDAIPGRINVATTLRLLILHSLGIYFKVVAAWSISFELIREYSLFRTIF